MDNSTPSHAYAPTWPGVCYCGRTAELHYTATASTPATPPDPSVIAAQQAQVAALALATQEIATGVRMVRSATAELRTEIELLIKAMRERDMA